MSTYQSVSSVGINDGTPTNVVVPKPSGLAVGDLMIAGIRSFRSSATVAITPPVGWTTEETNLIVSGGSPCQRLSVFSKIANSSDVAASDFTFTTDSSSKHGGIIVRISASGLTNAGETGGTVQTSTGSSTLTGFTPSRASCLFVFFATRGENVTGSGDITSVSLATNNPTWTERAQVTLNGTNNHHVLSCFTATRPETSATGTITYNFATSSNALTNGIMIAVSPQVNGSITQETKLNAYALSPIQSVALDAIVEDPTTRTGIYTMWTNPDKPSTTWTNVDK